MTNPSGVPSFPEGSVIIVDPSRTEAHGALVVVRFDNESEATFKRYEEDGGSKLLVPLNPSFPTIPIDRPATFCGVVVSRAEEEFS
jgi:SOS-response transcriptional repressor LexA